MKKTASGGSELIWYILSALLFVYLLIRAVRVPVLHDEVATLNIYVLSGQFLPWNAWPDANNHLLNSFFAWVSCKVFGIHAWSLRLPNVLLSLLFFVSVIGISRSFQDRFLRLGFIISLLLTHGFIEFFAFARGYGISLSFLLFSLFMIFKWQRNNSPWYFIAALCSIMLASMANLNLLPSMLMIGLYIIVLWMTNLQKQQLKANIVFVFFLILATFLFRYLMMYSFELKNAGLLYYGGAQGFFDAVIRTHSKMLFMSISNIILIAIILLFLLTLIVTVFKFFKTPLMRFIQPDFALFPLLLFGSLAVIFLMHFFMKVNFPEDRTSIFLYPYLIGSVFFLADQYTSKIRRLLLIPFIYIPLNFLTNLNTAYSFHWHYERIPPEFAYTVRDNSTMNPSGYSTISGYKIFEFIWGYHTRFSTDGVNLLNPHNYPNDLDDFILLRKEEADSMPGFFAEYDVLMKDPYSHISLLKKKIPSKRSFVFQSNIMPDDNEFQSEYLNFFPDTLFDFPGKSIMLEFDIQFLPGSGPEGSVLVASVRDSLNNNLMYQRIETVWLNKKDTENIQVALSLINIPENAAGLIVYLWNKHLKLIRIRHANVKVYHFGE